MKKIYLVFIPFLFLLLSACKKEKPDSYDNLLAKGTWELYDYQASTYMNPPFTNGEFTFKPGGRCEYKDNNGNVYTGTWDHIWHDDLELHALIIDVQDPKTQDKKWEYFDDIQFLSSFQFNAYMYHYYEPFTFRFRHKD
jgi:hypothetical protein